MTASFSMTFRGPEKQRLFGLTYISDELIKAESWPTVTQHHGGLVVKHCGMLLDLIDTYPTAGSTEKNKPL